MRILVVDDDPGMTDLLTILLTPASAEVLTANNAIDGIRLIRKMPTLTSSQFQDTIQFDLRVVGRVHHLRRRYEGDQGMPEMRHSTTIIVEAVSDQVEQILAEVLVVLESEDNLYQDLKNQGMTGI